MASFTVNIGLMNSMLLHMGISAIHSWCYAWLFIKE